jgi:hypothetical protein
MNKIMISCFDKSTVMAKLWANVGFLCYCVDLQHPAGETREGNIIKVGADINHWIPPRGEIVFAAFFPPCTDLAVSGGRWFKQKGSHRLSNAIGLLRVALILPTHCIVLPSLKIPSVPFQRIGANRIFILIHAITVISTPKKPVFGSEIIL